MLHVPVLQSLMPLRALNEFLPRPSATCGGINRGIRDGQRGGQRWVRGENGNARVRSHVGAGDCRRRRAAALPIALSRSNRGRASTVSRVFRGHRRGDRRGPNPDRGRAGPAPPRRPPRHRQRVSAPRTPPRRLMSIGLDAGFASFTDDMGDVGGHSRRWRTGSRWRHRGRAPCTRGRSWPTGWSPARTRRSPSKPVQLRLWAHGQEGTD